ncbi:DUF4429 domain-containing protein [Actinocorallia sp. A-T 12471]|uniref:DUF4429 domain-containing protein n=1 Tax=Actinocorallia sp. A-T 12471 TaxID=3089813 RepID=UPI0029CB8DFA|nr:DUF4429 domain-containing protein [Actinocorallia sp. A-T 12471]MDX6738429.1 DUF4429 domain-containing protein [Actinocorallia sp. A-T 12471]
MAEYVGYNGRIVLEGDVLVLVREGVRAKVSGHEVRSRRIPLQAVSDVRFREAGRLVNGHLQLGLGGVEPRVVSSGSAASDPDTVLFTWKKRDEFGQLYAWLRNVVEINRRSGIDASAVPYDGGVAGGIAAVEGKIAAAGQRLEFGAGGARGSEVKPGAETRSAGKVSWPVVNPSAVTPQRLPQLVAAPAWLPGDVEVEVVGEYYRQDSVRAAEGSGTDGTHVAVLVPEPSFAEHPNSVAIYVQTHLVGYLPSGVGHQVRPAILSFAAAHGGQLPSCPAEFHENRSANQVVLLLDGRPLGLSPEALTHVPDMAKSATGLLRRLDQRPPLLQGRHDGARRSLATAGEKYVRVKEAASGERSPKAWTALESSVNELVSKLEKAGDPMVADAWLLLARCTRFQKGRRDDTLAAYVNALFSDRDNVEAWSEFLEYICSAAHVPTLLDIYARVPMSVRPSLVHQFLAVSHGADRHGGVTARGGARLRAALESLAESQNDDGTVAVLAADRGLRAEKAGDVDDAVAGYRRAVAAGSTDAKVADRLSIWLVKQGLHAEAAAVLTQALSRPPEAASTRERLEKRLQRCERALS